MRRMPTLPAFAEYRSRMVATICAISTWSQPRVRTMANGGLTLLDQRLERIGEIRCDEDDLDAGCPQCRPCVSVPREQAKRPRN